MYCIKDGYKHRTSEKFFNDTKNTDKFQKEIYKYARQLLDDMNLSSVLDVGCGSGYKLINNFDNTVGADLESTVNFLKDKYPNREWMVSDFEDLNHGLEFDMILCVDVIEHVLCPDKLLTYLNSFNFVTGIISTPERDIIRGPLDMGPPYNTHHIREWNSEEFKKYVGMFFKIVDHKILNKHDQFVVVEQQ